MTAQAARPTQEEIAHLRYVVARAYLQKPEIRRAQEALERLIALSEEKR